MAPSTKTEARANSHRIVPRTLGLNWKNARWVVGAWAASSLAMLGVVFVLSHGADWPPDFPVRSITSVVVILAIAVSQVRGRLRDYPRQKIRDSIGLVAFAAVWISTAPLLGFALENLSESWGNAKRDRFLDHVAEVVLYDPAGRDFERQRESIETALPSDWELLTCEPSKLLVRAPFPDDGPQGETRAWELTLDPQGSMQGQTLQAVKLGNGEVLYSPIPSKSW